MVVYLSLVINGKATISAEMALRLEVWIGGVTSETWIRMQTEYDIWQARHKTMFSIKLVKAPSAV